MEHAVHVAAGGDQLTRLMHGLDTRWWRGHLGKTNLVILQLLITSTTNGYDGSMMNNLQFLDTWQDYFNPPTRSILGVFNASQSISGIAGLPFAPYLNDRLGRRATIFIGSCLMLIGVTLRTAAQNVCMFIGCRLLIGFGLAPACLAAPVIIPELAFPMHREPLTSLYNSSWYLGSIVAAWTAFGTFRINSTWAWRLPSLLRGLPLLVQFLLIFLIPESPRWLIDHVNDEQAINVIRKFHYGGDANDPLIDFEYNEIKEALRLEKIANASSTYKSLFVDKGNLSA